MFFLSIQNRLVLQAVNIFLRGSTILFRLGLFLFLAKYASLIFIGLFGLISGFVAIVPSCFGWGLNFYVSRNMVGKSRAVAGQMLWDRLFITFASFLGLFFLLLILQYLNVFILNFSLFIFIALLLLFEMIVFDIHFCFLLPMGLSFFANVLIFIRNSAWIPFLPIFYIYNHSLLSLELVLALWLLGYLFSLFLFFCFFRFLFLVFPTHAGVRRSMSSFFTKPGFLIYLNDLYYSLGVYLDRFVISISLGLQATGIYLLFWQIANSVTTLVSSGSWQVFSPKINLAGIRFNLKRWIYFLRQLVFSSIVSFVFIFIACYLLIPYLLHLIGKNDILIYLPILWILLAGSIFKILSDVMALGLSSLFQDLTYAYTSVFGFVLSFLLLCIGTFFGTLFSIALSVTLSFIFVFFIRFCFLSIIVSKYKFNIRRK